jgi:hypothetical protein
MKFLVSLLVFASTLTLGIASLANTGEGDRDMNALFPPPQPNVALSQPPVKVELETPTYYQKISDDKVTLKWKEGADAPVYHVQVATDPNFKWLVKEEHLYKGTSLEVSGLEAGKHYFWRVAGVKPENKKGDIKGPYATSMFETPTK